MIGSISLNLLPAEALQRASVFFLIENRVASGETNGRELERRNSPDDCRHRAGVLAIFVEFDGRSIQ